MTTHMITIELDSLRVKAALYDFHRHKAGFAHHSTAVLMELIEAALDTALTAKETDAGAAQIKPEPPPVAPKPVAVLSATPPEPEDDDDDEMSLVEGPAFYSYFDVTIDFLAATAHERLAIFSHKMKRTRMHPFCLFYEKGVAIYRVPSSVAGGTEYILCKHVARMGAQSDPEAWVRVPVERRYAFPGGLWSPRFRALRNRAERIIALAASVETTA